MTDLTLYIIIGLIFATLVFLKNYFFMSERKRKNIDEKLKSFSDEMFEITFTQILLMHFILSALLWPVGLIISIYERTIGVEDIDND